MIAWDRATPHFRPPCRVIVASNRPRLWKSHPGPARAPAPATPAKPDTLARGRTESGALAPRTLPRYLLPSGAVSRSFCLRPRKVGWAVAGLRMWCPQSLTERLELRLYLRFAVPIPRPSCYPSRMAHYIYYAPDLSHHIRIHEGSCPWCKDGKGITGKRPDRWHGPYDTLGEATIQAIAMSKDYSLCGQGCCASP